MRFTLSAVLALASIAQESDAFLSPALRTKTTAIHMNPEDEENEEPASGSSRFKEMMAAAKTQQGQGAVPRGRPIENPFLNPSAPPPVNPGDLSVEEQARMFREMMAGTAVPTPPPVRVAREDRAGRPVGRNPDADKISNTSDLYFAQLKRDSTVRTLARQRDDSSVSEAVFQDDGIKQLDDLLQNNPHLQSQKDEEREMLENLPDEIVAPYFNTKPMEEDELTKTGINYKKILAARTGKKGEEGTAPAPAPLEQPAPPAPQQPEPVVAQVSTPPPPPPKPEPVPEPEPEVPRPVTVTSSKDGRVQNIRTLMGLTLKHRGGPGFGGGRLKGPDIDLFEGLVDEISNMLGEEAKLALPPIDTPAIPTMEATPTTVAPPVTVQAPAAVPAPAAVSEPVASSTEAANIDSTIACIEGAITMYNNSPPAIRESVLVTLRAALMSAVDTCNIALAQPATPVAASPDGSIEGMVACIEGAVTMYKNSPPALKDSVMVTLRMALMSAVETCNVIIGDGQVAPPPPPATPAPVAPQTTPATSVAPEPVTPQAQAPPATSVVPEPPAPQAPPATSEASPPTEENSKALESVLEKVIAASGDGKLGLRSDLTDTEADELADQLVNMRGILMDELNSDKPAPDSSQASQGTASKYEQMLAKARAEKAQA